MSNDSISRRFNRSIIRIVIGLLLLFSVSVVIYGVKKMNLQLNNKMNYALKLAQTSLPRALWNMDTKSVDEILSALFLDMDVVYLSLSVEGEITYEKVRQGFGESNFAFFQSSSDFLWAEDRILHRNKEIGNVRIVLSKDSFKSELNNQLMAVIVMALILIGVITVRSMTISRKLIFHPLAGLERSASSIAGGNLDAQIICEGDDEIGKLGRSFNTMRESVKKLVTDLNSVNEELEQRVEMRTAELLKSTEELKRAKEEAETSGRYKTALNELSDILHSGNEIQEMAGNLSRYIAEFLKLPLIGFFVKTSGKSFSRAADFGYYKKEGLPDSFEFGSGMIGQVAKERKPIMLKDIPEYARISFGFGEVSPRVIYIYPLVYDDQTIAVLELGNFNDFSETELEWIKEAAKNVTLALQTILSISELKEIMQLEWDESYDVGISEFNAQHKRLIIYVNSLFDAINQKENDQAIGAVLNGLTEYTKTHFAAEENLMEKYGYPDYESHKEEHNTLASEVIEIYNRFDSGEKINLATLLIFLVNWLKEHIKKTDKRYGPYLNRKGIT